MLGRGVEVCWGGGWRCVGEGGGSIMAQSNFMGRTLYRLRENEISSCVNCLSY